MRMTLEELKGLDDKKLFATWMEGTFPFDVTSQRCGCMTTHTLSDCERGHEAFSEEVEKVVGRSFYVGPQTILELRKHLEELYAIRLFFDNLYDQEKEICNGVKKTKQEEKEVRSEDDCRCEEGS